MNTIFRRARRAIVTPLSIPEPHRSNFVNLYWDVAWFGVLNGSTLSFLVIFATRQGASEMQIGLINAMPAVINLLFAIPASSWLNSLPLRKGVFWSAVAYRLFYLLLIPLPALLLPAAQIWVITALTLLMSIPGTALSVGFNTLFAEAVPIEYRGRVTGIRNATLALVTTLTSLSCGYLLVRVDYPAGYQVVFAIGFLGAVLSTLFLWRVRPLARIAGPAEDRESPAVKKGNSLAARLRKNFRLDLLNGPFGLTMLLLFVFHFGQYIAIPVFPIFTVNELQLSDQIISIGTGLFNLTTFFASLRLERYVRRLGNHKVMAIGAAVLGVYPMLFTLSRGVPLYLLASLVGGLTWALVSGALFNYLLERIPEDNRPSYLAWYALVSNAALLLGSIAGPLTAGWIGLRVSLVVFAILRWTAAAAIWFWGGERNSKNA